VPSINPGSRTFLVKVCIGVAKDLMPGMFGTLSMTIGSEKSIIISADAISRTGQLEFVTLLRDGTPEKILVRSIPHTRGMVKIVAGLKPGDRICYSFSGE